MSNSKYNCYPAILISNTYQVHGWNPDQSTNDLSDPGFASAVAISDDGTLWAISTTPDPDGGGGKLYWSDVGAEWNEISTNDPGGIAITGGSGSSCYFLTTSGAIWTMDTNGTGKKVFDDHLVIEMDAGGGYIWVIMSENGGIPALYYSPIGATFNFQKFPIGDNATPYSLSVNFEGNCFAVENDNPVYYGKDGTSKGSAGTGLDGKAMAISNKKNNFALSIYDTNSDGNLIYEWTTQNQGSYSATSTRTNTILSTYYVPQPT